MQRQCAVTVLDDASGIEAYVVIDASVRDLSFGGMRVDRSVTRELVAELADNMSQKLAGHGSPVGGAKAGIRALPDDPQLASFLGRFAERCRDLLTSTTILGKDMGAKQWMIDAIYSRLGIPQLEVARRRGRTADCPERLCDLGGYVRHMTGLGVFWSIEQALGGSVRGARVLIQGFGVVGAGAAWHLARAGARVVGVSDCEKALLGGEDTSLEEWMAARTESGVLDDERLPRGCRRGPRDELLAQPADVLVLAASSHVVDPRLAGQIRAPLVVEAANLALQPGARTVLHGGGVRVVPDVVANSASAALVGHQIAAANTRDPKALWAEIEHDIRSNTEAVEQVSRQFGVDPKLAFRRLAESRSAAARREAATAQGLR